MSSPHFIPLAVALDVLHSCAALLVDDTDLRCPTWPAAWCADTTFMLLMGGADMSYHTFEHADNAEVAVEPDGLWLTDTKGQTLKVMPLMAAPIKTLLQQAANRAALDAQPHAMD